MCKKQNKKRKDERKKTKSNNRKVVKKLLTFFFLMSVAYVALDYFNIPKSLGIEIDRLNMDVFSAFFDNAIVMLIAVITYLLIDRKNIEKQKNQEEIIFSVMESIYKTCKENVDLFETPQITEMLVRKTDFNSTEYDNLPAGKLAKAAFLDEAIIIDAFKEGILNKTYFDDYIKMKNAYKKFMLVRITFFDAPEVFAPVKHEFESCFNEGISAIENRNKI